ncbi:MAG: hypothetical protein QM770_14215 [Tepidisphaeraceae bacterium]
MPLTDPREQDRLEDLERSRKLRKSVASEFFAGQFLFILKNVIGWALMLIAWPIGVALPGPGGIPIFLLGFALATIPGKRRMTTHVMRGRPVRVRPGAFVAVATALSVIVVFSLFWFFHRRREWILDTLNLRGSSVGERVLLITMVVLIAVVVCWVTIRVALLAVNFFLRGLPRARRMVKPWLKKHGIHFLPARRAEKRGGKRTVNENEILEISPEGKRKFANVGWWLVNWLIRVAALSLLLWILWLIVLPLMKQFGALRALGQG